MDEYVFKDDDMRILKKFFDKIQDKQKEINFLNQMIQEEIAEIRQRDEIPVEISMLQIDKEPWRIINPASIAPPQALESAPADSEPVKQETEPDNE